MKINGKEYELPELTYNAVCELDKYGVNLLAGDNISPFVMLRGFLALCLRNKIAAGDELEQHIINHGPDSLSEAMENIGKCLEESRFFIKMKEKAEKDKEKEAKAARAAKSLPGMKET